jgi:hypothetical protein
LRAMQPAASLTAIVQQVRQDFQNLHRQPNRNQSHNISLNRVLRLTDNNHLK